MTETQTPLREEQDEQPICGAPSPGGRNCTQPEGCRVLHRAEYDAGWATVAESWPVSVPQDRPRR